MTTGIFDKNGIEVKEGDVIRESHRLTNGAGREFDIALGTVEIVRGCHVLNLGSNGTYSFYDRYPDNTGLQHRIWEIQVAIPK